MAPHPTTFQYLGLIVLGFGAGTYGVLIGTGGGLILMPVLLLLYPHDSPEQLTAISLAVIFFNSVLGSGAQAHMKRIDYKSGLLLASAAVPGAILGVLTTAYVSRHVFDAIFSSFMIIAGVVLFVRPRSEERAHAKTHKKSAFEITRHLPGINGISYEYSYNPVLGLALSFLVGYISSFLGIGGGIIRVPLMAYLLNFPVHLATATSYFVRAFMTFTGTITHIWIGTFHHGAHRTAALAVGVLAGAQCGVFLSDKVKKSWIIRGPALVLVAVGAIMIIRTFW
jgi:uncharacterized membrane protein YfcA